MSLHLWCLGMVLPDGSRYLPGAGAGAGVRTTRSLPMRAFPNGSTRHSPGEGVDFKGTRPGEASRKAREDRRPSDRVTPLALWRGA